jgi:hypothetical protein
MLIQQEADMKFYKKMQEYEEKLNEGQGTNKAPHANSSEGMGSYGGGVVLWSHKTMKDR